MKKTLEDLFVTKLDDDLFATDEPVYILTKEGTKLTDLPHGSIVYTGEIIPFGNAGFFCGICMIWEGNNTPKTKKMLIRKLKG